MVYIWGTPFNPNVSYMKLKVPLVTLGKVFLNVTFSTDNKIFNETGHRIGVAKLYEKLGARLTQFTLSKYTVLVCKGVLIRYAIYITLD
tara:strand:+ start:1356 stop:1622 length:267 start_codon:yes stop_codon:yes gene_type:complete